MSVTDLAAAAKAWPFEQARELKARIEKLEKAGRPKDAPVIFETGYGPSGLPHIGTFGEVVRTTMVRRAFEALTGGQYKTRLICVSDDMDGMRKVPDTVPNPEKLHQYMQMPLTVVPDPFGTHESYGAHMNSRLRAFLDSFGFQYEFASATDLYKSGRFDAMLLRAAEKYDDIMKVMLPTLGDERRETYSPFLPISPTTGRVLYVPMKKVDAKAGTVTFVDENGEDATLPVTGGHVKLQWKPDFGMRWAALGVDFEMFGKDHQANAPIYSKIAKILGAEPPQQFVYELFLDEKGEKISKTKGNGISVEQWLAYAPAESLSLYQWQKPKTAKKLYFDVIPKAVDEYLQFLDAYAKQTPEQQLENPAWHIHGGAPPAKSSPVSFAMLLNLVSAANATNRHVLWGFIRREAPNASPATDPLLDRLVDYALEYYSAFVKPTKIYRLPDAKERAALEDLAATLERLAGQSERMVAQRARAEKLGLPIEEIPPLPKELDGETLQTEVYAVGRRHEFEPMFNWFKAIYEVCLGQSQGPRFGGFIALYGVRESAQLIRGALGDVTSSAAPYTKDGKELEALVASVERVLVPEGFEVHRGRRQFLESGQQEAEFDVEVIGKFGSSRMRWLIECRDRPSGGPAPAAWIEQLAGRRIRFRYNKVSAVSTTGFTHSAIEAAKDLDVELRTVSELTDDALRSWMTLSEIEWLHRSATISFAKILLDEKELPESRAAVLEILKGKKTDEPVLLSTSTKEHVTVNSAALAAIQNAGLFESAEPGEAARRFRLMVDYPNDQDHFVIELPDRPVRVKGLLVEGTVAVRRETAPIVAKSRYARSAPDEQIAEVVTFAPMPASDGDKYSLEFHRMPDGTRVTLRRTK